LTCFGVSLALAVLYNYTTRPVYRATTQILIDRDTPDVLPNKELVELVQGGADYYQTQYQLLRGRSLAERAGRATEAAAAPGARHRPMITPGARAPPPRPPPPQSWTRAVCPSPRPPPPSVPAVDVDPLPARAS